MSGVVVALNDDDDEEEDDSEVLLAADRNGGSSFRGAASKSRSKRHGRSSKSSVSLQRTVVRAGNVNQLINTLTLCCIFFGIGFTKSLLDDAKFGDRTSTQSQAQMASSVGYIVGFPLGGFLLAKFGRFFILFLSTLVLGCSLLAVPWTKSLWAVDTVHTVIGVALAVLMAGGNVICLDFWGRKSGPYIQALHFCLSLGLLTGPVLVDPLAQTKVPDIVKNALPLAPKAAVANSSVALSSATTHFDVAFGRSKREVQLETGTTVDTLLAEILGSSPPETSTMQTSTTTEPTKKPKPKPAFNDGSKLDNSRDWETVKIARPPPEEVRPVTSSTSTSSTSGAADDGPSIEEIFNFIDGKNAEVEHKEASSSSSTASTEATSTTPVIDVKHEVELIREDMTKSREIISMLDNQSSKKSPPQTAPLTARRRREVGRARDPLGRRPVLYDEMESHRKRLPHRSRDRDSYDERYGQMGGGGAGGWDDFEQGGRSFGGGGYNNDYPLNYPQLGGVGVATEVPSPKQVEDAVETLTNYLMAKNLTEEDSNGATVKTTVLTSTSTAASSEPSTSPSTSSSSRITNRDVSDAIETSESTSSSTSTSTTRKPVHRMKPMSSFDNGTDVSGQVTLMNVLNNYGVSQRNVGFIIDGAYSTLLSLILLFCLCYNPREPRSRQDEGVRTEESRIFKCTVTVLLFFFSLLHWGMFTYIQHVLPSMLTTSMPYLQQAFVGIFTGTRFLALFTSGLFNPAVLIFTSLTIIFIGCVVLVSAQQISSAAIWAGVIMQSMGLATLLPTSLVWGEAYVLMSAPVVSLVCSGVALGELGVPQLFTQLAIETNASLGLALLGSTLLCAGVFTCVFLVARKHGSRFSRPQASGYELANQDELNQELLEDDDDFEVTEPVLRFSANKDTEA